MKAITLFGKMLTFSRLKITTDSLDDIKNELTTIMTSNAKGVPVVVDCDKELDLKALVDILWELGVQPIGVVEGVLTEQANALRLATFPTDGKRIERIKPSEPKADTAPADKTDNADKADKPEQAETADKADTANTTNTTEKTDKPTPQKPPKAPLPDDNEKRVQAVAKETQTANLASLSGDEQGITSVVHHSLLRSGQSVQHLGGDLVIVGGINKGAEAITDNNLHVYGHGQGRLVAGATGDKDAYIFCQKFNPSLVSVAGTYCLSESIPPEMIDKPVQVSYDEKQGLVFTLLTA